MDMFIRALMVFWSIGLLYFIVSVLSTRHAKFQEADTRYDWERLPRG